MKRLWTLPLFLVAGCAGIPTPGSRSCDLAAARRFTGALATADVGRTLLRGTHARSIRWLQPGSMATMDYRPDRLNVRVDARNFITGIDCG